MTNSFIFKDLLPVAPLKIAILESCRNLAAKVNDHIVQPRHNDIEELMRRKEDLHYHGYDMDSYLLYCSCSRLGAGEGKVVVNESVRDTDIFAMMDMMNYSIPYMASNYINHTSPDDHSQDLKWIAGACFTTAHRVGVAMPFLYGSHQRKRSKYESLGCAVALEELVTLDMEDIATFDAHNPQVQNAIPLVGFGNFISTYQFIKALFSHDSNIRIDREHLVVISPDKGAMSRAVYFANNLGVDMGMFYRRRDYSRVIDGRNPIVAHEFSGSPTERETVFIIDDMISSGESMLDACKELREHKVDKIIVCCIFGLFTNGFEKFGEYYHQGYLDYVATTNLNYHIQKLIDREWYLEAGMSKYLAAVINPMNHDRSISAFFSPTEKIQKLVQKRQNGGYGYFQKLVQGPIIHVKELI